MKILLPIALDRVNNPISTLLRKIVEGNPDLVFFSFSDPITPEDHHSGESLWSLGQLTRARYADIMLQSFDVVHHASATKKNYPVSRFVKMRRLGRTRHLFTANCQPYPTHPLRELLMKCVRNADHVVSVSKVVAEDFERQVGRASDAIIPNGFSSDFYTPCRDRDSVEKILGFHEPYLLYASAFMDRKRPDFLLDIAEKMTEIKFVMVGSSADSEIARESKARAATMQNVHFLGMRSREDLRNLMQGAEALVYPSEFEGLPLTVIEALGVGLPIVAQPKSSLPELIRDGENGWLIDADHEDRWISRLRDILGWSKEEREGHAQAARSSVLPRFDWTTIAAQYGALYRRIAKP